jgi:SAM-dependent methyltransferase
VRAEVEFENCRSWNRISRRRATHFPPGGETLAPFELELAGDVKGRHVVHLACSFGDEVLAWSRLGARATGVDIAEAAVDIARHRAEKAAATAQTRPEKAAVTAQTRPEEAAATAQSRGEEPATTTRNQGQEPTAETRNLSEGPDFRCADMGNLPDDLTDIDLFYLSWGAICWVPDLEKFATHLAGRLKPGGAVLLCDHHPIWEILATDDDDHLTIAGDYFGRQNPNTVQHREKRPQGAEDETFQPFVWPVSDVVMAFVHAGLRLDAFFEAPEPSLYNEALPAYYVVKATRP